RGRLVRQLVTESLVLALPGGLLGLLLAAYGLQALVALAPEGLPRVAEIALDARVLAFTVGLTIITAVAFGLGPALGAARTDLNPAGHAGARVAGARGMRRWQQVMAVGQLALAQVLLVGATLLLVSFTAAQRVDLGFDPAGRVAADLSLSADRYLKPIPGREDSFDVDTGPKLRFIDDVLSRMAATRGVWVAAASFTAPMRGGPNRGVAIEGDPEPAPGLEPNADFQVISPGYFQALGMTLVRGRAFTAADRSDAPKVAVVNAAFVDRYLAGRDPLRAVIRFGGDQLHAIVGVVGNARYRDVEQPAEPTFYVPLAQNTERWPFLSFTVATAGDAAAMAPLLRQAIREADPDQPIVRVRTYDEILSTALAGRRFNTLLVGIFALTALLLAAVGTYGVTAYGVAQRTREIGIRTALGATPRAVLGMMAGQGLLLAAVAVGIGAAGALAATRLMRSLLFGVTPGDPATMAAVAGVLGVIAVAATVIPARRAARVDPVTALREP
ncbi:MAG: FtsX-like permease family protein, partial [Vicinamibacterales bacterium]